MTTSSMLSTQQATSKVNTSQINKVKMLNMSTKMVSDNIEKQTDKENKPKQSNTQSH